MLIICPDSNLVQSADISTYRKEYKYGGRSREFGFESEEVGTVQKQPEFGIKILELHCTRGSGS